ncbi:GNAT family N-acetyltransferase [Novosphingobium sp. TH158]|uniref:GNAT family N-acetyltransferase n=1 Tax=Novosphingobium sp. TH158 TaxID=2067455 RepID=UPI000C797A2F|nr:GNAT family N-acetyltransferase [Novosphingobium sp. TH158]PLK27503.1 GNAT family N-acetyltransferase [Novosphingobium sp. TH158]
MTTQLSTRSGIALDVRIASEADEAALAAFFDSVSDEDRRFRFLAAAEHVSHEQLDPLIHADHYQSESFLAFDSANGALVGSALLACDKALDTGEIAVSIRSDYKGKGVGWALLDFLGSEARRRGVRRVIAIESRDNHAAIELEREKGFTPEPFEGEPTLVILSKTFR